MANDDRHQKGVDKFNEVYAGTLPSPPAGTLPFFDVMVEQLFGEVWTRPALSVRDRRLLVMGVIAALGEKDLFGVQIRAALKNGELTPEQCRETVIQLAQYAGYPRTAGLVRVVEEILAETPAT